MASVIRKTINGRTYFYLAESARVDGRPRIVSQRYLGTADDLARLAAGDAPGQPVRTRHLAFGDVAAVWGVLAELDLVGLVDSVVGARRSKLSTGTCLALAVLHQVVSPAGGTDLAGWWPATAAPRFVRPRLDVADLQPRRLWQALRRLDPMHLDQIQAALVPHLPAGPVLAVDVPVFATYARTDAAGAGVGVDSGPLLTGLGTVLTLDGAVPLVSELYRHPRDPGQLTDHPTDQRPDHQPPDTSFRATVHRLADRYRELRHPAPGEVTVVVDAGQSAQLDFETRAGMHFVASLPLADHPALVARSAAGRRAVDRQRFPGTTVLDARARVGGVDRRVLVIHSRTLQAAQERTLAEDLASAARRLDELASALRDGTLRRTRDQVLAEIARITRFRWINRVLSTTLTGAEPGGLRLHWAVDEVARHRLRTEVFGRQLLLTDHEDWSAADVLTAYRARYRLESTLRQRGAALVTPPSRSWQWDDHTVAVHAFVCVLATTVTHLMRRRAQGAGLDLSVRDVFDRLAGIEETVLQYPSTGGRPRTRRLLADRDDTEQQLFDLFRLDRYAPRG